jgi:hypothetical protein
MDFRRPRPRAEKELPRLRWYQWRLRSLFLLTLLAAIAMSYVSVTVQSLHKQKAIADEIRAAGGLVKSEKTWLGRLLRDNSLANVTGVVLDGASGSDARLEHLKSLTQLQVLHLADARISDAGLVHLAGFHHLESLVLRNTRITDAGLAHLEGLRYLRNLDLDNTQISDSGLAHLERLERLELLFVHGTKITDHGINRLKEALRNCSVSH